MINKIVNEFEKQDGLKLAAGEFFFTACVTIANHWVGCSKHFCSAWDEKHPRQGCF